MKLYGRYFEDIYSCDVLDDVFSKRLAPAAEMQDGCAVLLETLLLVWVFSSYQAFVPMFLALCAGVYLAGLSSDTGSFDAGEQLRRIAWMSGVFLAAFISNTVWSQRFLCRMII